MLASSDEFTSFLARDPYFKNRMDKVLKDKLTTEEFVFANKYGSKFYGFFNGQESAEDIYANYKLRYMSACLILGMTRQCWRNLCS